ncbi:unnamed protein product [Arabidopsis thaliana]|uniref:(thale cress) hypothetical protein n=1 Tax=Arabidopsis thaliana TaxID=3702 RepID=A0A7G2EFX3_ARATH|nr:unnamed protein product [Arabidopsis thaliana]
MNHNNAYSGNLTTPSESSLLISRSGIALNWTTAEDDILIQLLDSYSSDSRSAVTRYLQILEFLHDKTIRDVAARSRWIYEIVNMVLASQVYQPSQVFQPSQHGVHNELLNHNKQWFNQIYANLTFLNLTDNLDLFRKIRENIKSLLKDLNENVSETWKNMPSSLPEKLNDELFLGLDKAIPSTSNLP